MSIEAVVARAFQLLLALTGAYTVALWFALIVWTFRDIESRSRSVIAQIFSTLVVVLFFIPGVLIYLILRPKETLDEAFGRSLEEEYLLQDLEDLSLCSTCHRPVRDEYVVCPHCYTELRRNCPSCARLVDMTWAVCPYCTVDLVEEPEEVDVREVPWAEQPTLLPGALRMLRERTEVQVKHSLDFVPPEEAPQLPEGETPGPLIARETQESGTWADDTGKRAWILTRAREVFQPLPPAEGAPHANSNGAVEHAPLEHHDQVVVPQGRANGDGAGARVRPEAEPVVKIVPPAPGGSVAESGAVRQPTSGRNGAGPDRE